MTKYFVSVDSANDFQLPQVVLDNFKHITDPLKLTEAIREYLERHPTGLTIEDVSYTHNQPTPASTWEFEHPLKFEPSVTIKDSAGTEVLTEVSYPTPSTVRSISAHAFSGTAKLS